MPSAVAFFRLEARSEAVSFSDQLPLKRRNGKSSFHCGNCLIFSLLYLCMVNISNDTAVRAASVVMLISLCVVISKSN